jgi:hypothetical protein
VVGLVDQGSWGGGGKIWQRGVGLVEAVATGTVAAVVVLAAVAAVAAAVVPTAVAEEQGQPLVGLLLRLGGDDGSS